jgi:hypothetical protein
MTGAVITGAVTIAAGIPDTAAIAPSVGTVRSVTAGQAGTPAHRVTIGLPLVTGQRATASSVPGVPSAKTVLTGTTVLFGMTVPLGMTALSVMTGPRMRCVPDETIGRTEPRCRRSASVLRRPGSRCGRAPGARTGRRSVVVSADQPDGRDIPRAGAPQVRSGTLGRGDIRNISSQAAALGVGRLFRVENADPRRWMR